MNRTLWPGLSLRNPGRGIADSAPATQFPKVIPLMVILAGLGALTLVLGLFLSPALTWANLLLVSYLGIGLGLAGMVFVALHHVTGAGWSTALRRVPEAMAAILPVAGLGLIAVLLLYPSLYPWFDQESHSSHSGFKHAWLDRPFFLVRAAGYLLLWLLLNWAMVRTSRRQDVEPSPAGTLRNKRLAALFLVVFGITLWLASTDWIMSLEPDWVSTVFGLYNFAGLFVSGLAAMILLVLWLGRRGPLGNVLTPDHLHDLAKLLFGMSTFWAYLWYCQYMLIWYVNNPEETSYYVQRLHGAWAPLFWANLVLNWGIPFFVLLPRSAKRNPKVLVQVCVVVLLGRWLDLYLMIVPAVSPAQPLLGFLYAGLIAGAGGFFFLTFLRALCRTPLVPVNDPFLVESLPGHGR